MKASSLKGLYGLQQTSFVVVDHEGIVRYSSGSIVFLDRADILAIRSAIVQALADLAAARATDQGSITAVSADDRLPTQFSLEANFPNPFNASTNLPFSVRIEGPVSLEIFDVTGRTVRRLLEHQWLAPGTYDLTWDGRSERGDDVASGLYIYRLATPAASLARPMMLVR